MPDGIESPDELLDGEDKSIHDLQNYWRERLEEFEKVEYPVFYKMGYSKNTALMVVMMDELSDTLTVAAAIKRGDIK